MAGLRDIEGAAAPLFDRLRLSSSAAESQPLLALDREALEESVCRELTMLFNVRSQTPADRYAEGQLSVLDYGVPDFTAFSPQNSLDQQRLARLLTRAIAAFEPRLVRAQVAVAPVEGQPRALLVHITAGLLAGSIVAPISLTIALPGPGSPHQVPVVEILAAYKH